MSGKWFKIGLIASGALVMVLLAAGLTGVEADAKVAAPAAEGYVGSQACLGCHTEKYDSWKQTGHAHMMVPVFQPSDLPGDVANAPPELKAELAKAQYVIAGQRFIARDAKTGKLSYINVTYDAAAQKYNAYKGGSDWEAGCSGCHSTGWAIKSTEFSEPGIGCEACHGPGRPHILGRGDRSKIVRSTDAQVCGSCHNGGGSMPDSTARWPAGWKPGMNLKDVGFKFTAVKPSDPPPTAAQHLRQYAPLLVSGHTDAWHSLGASGHDRDSCYTCHSAEARISAAEGQPIKDMAILRNLQDGVSCVACHDPHKLEHEGQLRMSAEDLCMSCHTASLAPGTTFKPGAAVHHPSKEMLMGYGAIGVEPTKSAHQEVSCVGCHMTEGNHKFDLILPEAVEGTARKDSCSACHTQSTSYVRQAYLDMWQGTVKNKLENLKGNLAVAEARVKANPSLSAALVEKVNAAKTNISFVEADGSNGAHNFDFAMKTLVASEKGLGEFFTATR